MYIYVFFAIILVLLGLLLPKNYRARNKTIESFTGENLDQIDRLKLANKNYLCSLSSLFFSGLILVVYLFTLPKEKIDSHINPYEQNTKNKQFVILLDISNSMNAEDLGVSRLTAAKLFVYNLLEELLKAYKSTNNTNYKIIASLIVFAGDVSIAVPMSEDIEFIQQNISEITTDFSASQGTNLKLALNVSRNSFIDMMSCEKIILLATDAENHESALNQELDLIKTEKIEIKCVGFGTIAGAKIPENNKNSYMTDWQNNEIITKLDTLTLKKIDPNFEIYPTNAEAIANNLLQNYYTTKKTRDVLSTSGFQYVLLTVLLASVTYSFFKRGY